MRGDYHQSEGRIAPSPRSTSIPVGTPNGKRAWAGGRVGILIMCCCALQSATKECRTRRSGAYCGPRAQAAQAADSASLAKQGARGADAWARPLCTTCSLSLSPKGGQCTILRAARCAGTKATSVGDRFAHRQGLEDRVRHCDRWLPYAGAGQI